MAAYRKKHWIRLSFFLYLVLLIYLVLFSHEFGRVALPRGYNLKPFDTIMRYVNYREYFGEINYLANIYGNIVAFMPFGLFSFIYSLKPTWSKGILYPMLLSLAIELCQYKLSVGSFDVDDIILNTFGAAIVYMTMMIFMKMGVIRR